MNREIKFRAIQEFNGNISDLGKWRYGYYVKIARGSFINENGGNYKIKDETLGQFTGLHDRNGKEIYEGDVVKGEHVCPICSDDSPHIVLGYIICDVPTGTWMIDFGHSAMPVDQINDIEVIGNIY